MNDTYAVDPAAPASTLEVSSLVRLFDVGEGRFIANFPVSWTEELKRSLIAQSDLGSILAEEAKRRLQHALLPLRAPYVPSRRWMENAAAIAGRVRMVIGGADCGPIGVPLAEVLAALDGLPDSSGGYIRMVPAEYARIAAPLFQTSPTVCLVDKYFRLRRRSGRGWVRDQRSSVLKELLARAGAEGKTELIRLTVSREHALEDDPTGRAFMEAANSLAEEVGNRVSRIEYALLEDLAQTHSHGRYLLGVNSGMHVDHGFAVKVSAVNHVHWLRRAELNPLLDHFMRAPVRRQAVAARACLPVIRR